MTQYLCMHRLNTPSIANIVGLKLPVMLLAYKPGLGEVLAQVHAARLLTELSCGHSSYLGCAWEASQESDLQTGPLKLLSPALNQELLQPMGQFQGTKHKSERQPKKSYLVYPLFY